MSYLRKSSFSAGELDPALHERTNLDKYQSGLATLRNAFVGKTGRTVSRAGTRFVRETKYADKKCIIVSPPYSPYLIEWGHQYVRIHDAYESNLLDNNLTFTEDVHDWVEADLPYVQFVFQGKFAFIFREGKYMKKMVIGPLDPFDPFADSRFQTALEINYMPPFRTIAGFSTSGAGYFVDYRATYVINGQESLYSNTLSGGAYKMPIAAGQSNTIRLTYGPVGTFPVPSEIKMYRRPTSGNAFGYIGSSATPSVVGTDIVFDFIDLGGGADYTHAPPEMNADFYEFKSKTGVIYQQRLVVSDNKEGIHASRPGFTNNFFRDFPLDSDSSLSFKGGTTGAANVLRLLDNGSLIAFTTIGPYASNSGALTPDNLGMDRKGNWVIDESVPPLEIPGAVLFVDRSTNTIRSLIYSNEAGGYAGDELSIFSNHLFLGKRITSWTFQDGDAPLVWVTLDDGSLVSLTYQREHQMQAWARHDSNNADFEYSATVKSMARSTTYFVVLRNGKRMIECTTPRFVNDIKEFVGMDSSIVRNTSLNAQAITDFTISAMNPNDWTGLLQVKATFSVFTNTANNGAIGSTWRFFDKQGSAVDLTVTQFLNDTTVIVQPSVEFPFDEGFNATLYVLYSSVPAPHLEGQLVSVMVDGYVISSPNNDIENYPTVQVVGGTVTLPNELKGAFIRIGVPFTSDVETLDVDTVEQRPTLLEAKIVSRVFVRVYRTRGIFVGSKFPVNDALTDGVDADYKMEDPEHRDDIIDPGNAAQALISTRYEIPIANDWDSNGRICIRQVDPLPFEILSIIPDLIIS